MKFTLIGCGGTGINIIKKYAKKGIFKSDFDLLGLDTSDANILNLPPEVKIEMVPGTNGSGSDPSKNAEKYPEFLKRVLTQYDIGDVVLLCYSGSGGTGSSMGPILHRMLIDKKVPTISVVIGDMSYINEATNTVSCFLNLNVHTETGHPVIYTYYENTPTNNHGDINDDICMFTDSIRVLLSNDNERIDRADIQHLFFYNDVVKAAPVISRLEILSEEGIKNYTRNAVAAISLFNNEDNIRQVLPQLLYRKAGIFGESFKDAGYESLHVVLDHGDSLEELKGMLNRQRKVNAETNHKYQVEKDESLPEVGNTGAGHVKFDI